VIYGSVCSGIEAATVAWKPMGWKASFFSEIEKFPMAVLGARYPEVSLHRDFTTIKGGDYEPIELLVGGTPCQSFSVAGLRKGLEDDRGNLALEYLKLAKRLSPRWLVWENVPGVLSSNGGRDFGSFLGALVELGYGWSYRVLDAQYFGVPQRRKRVFVIAYLGDWRPPAAVLFERHSLCGNTTPSREERKEVTGDAGKSSFSTSGAGYWRDGIGALRSRDQDSHENIATMAHGQGGAEVREDGKSPTLTCNHEAPIVCHGTQDPCVSDKAFALGQNNGQENVIAIKTANTKANGSNINLKETMFTLDTSSQPHAVAFQQNTRDEVRLMGGDGQIAGALAAETGAKQQNYIKKGMQIRRLTPVECERLQEFPDNYTRIPWRGKDPENCPDGPRYKALGNSMAVPVMRWIGERIQMVDELHLT